MLPANCYPRKSLYNIPHGIALHLRRIMSDFDEKLNSRAVKVSKSVKLLMKYNPRLPDLNSLLKKHLLLLYTDPTLRTIFPEGCIYSVFKRNQS